jgi:hypothetical protein
VTLVVADFVHLLLLVFKVIVVLKGFVVDQA